jgi:hypothetical protein
MEQKNEIWKKIPGFDNYEVSNLGRVKSINYKNYNKSKLLKPYKNKFGYLMVVLYKNKKRYNIFIHRLVLMAFKNIVFNKNIETNHINGIKKDNRPENLEACTCSENISHAYRIGLKSSVGENHNGSKLTEKDVIEIRKKFKSHNQFGRSTKFDKNPTQKELAKMYGVSLSAIKMVVQNRTWKHLNI